MGVHSSQNLNVLQGSIKQYNLCWVPSRLGVVSSENVDTVTKSAILLPNITEVETQRNEHKALV